MQCPSCSAENREGRRFCAECGASLALACSACGFSNEPGEHLTTAVTMYREMDMRLWLTQTEMAMAGLG